MREENSRKSWVEGKESEIKMIRESLQQQLQVSVSFWQGFDLHRLHLALLSLFFILFCFPGVE